MVKDYKKIDPWQLTNELAIHKAWSLRSSAWSLKSGVWCLKSEVQYLVADGGLEMILHLDILVPVYYDDDDRAFVLFPWHWEFSL